MAEPMGTRCAVCVGCGRCLADEGPQAQSWSGKRCAACVGCGECAKAWGIVPEGEGGVDAVSGPTSWADAFKVMDTGSAGAPPPSLAPPGVAAGGAGAEAGADALGQGARAFDGEGPALDEPEVDAVTGATPGVAAACKELGLDDMATVAANLGIKPPGVA